MAMNERSASRSHGRADRGSASVGVTIDFGVRAAALATPDKTALLESGRALTYRQLVDRMDRVASAVVEDLALRPGDTIILLAPNCLEYIEIVCGASSTGAAVATLNPRLGSDELTFIADDCKARAIIVHASLLDRIAALDLPSIERIIVLGGQGQGQHEGYDAWIARARGARPAFRPSEGDTFTVPYTSGTTGKPKGVMLSHRCRVLTFLGSAVEYGCYGPDDRYLAVAPLFHGAGFAFAMAAPFFGGFCEILPSYQPEVLLDKLHDGGYGGTFMVPTHFHALFALEPKLLESKRGNRLKALVSNAAPLAQATKHKIVDYFGDGVLHETYGSTEAGIVTNLRPADQLTKERCVGRPFPMTSIALLNDDRQPVPQGEVGELFSYSPYIFNGYYDRPEETEATLYDGMVTAGDLARMDDDRYFYLVDRKKDMIITGGINVYPREIEEVLFAHEAVREAAVVGVPDDYWGEKIVAYVVASGEPASDTDALLAYTRDRLASYKVPKEVLFVDALPRNAAGKVLKRELRSQESE